MPFMMLLVPNDNGELFLVLVGAEAYRSLLLTVRVFLACVSNGVQKS